VVRDLLFHRSNHFPDSPKIKSLSLIYSQLQANS
jgi:hypothetical protein